MMESQEENDERKDAKKTLRRLRRQRIRYSPSSPDKDPELPPESQSTPAKTPQLSPAYVSASNGNTGLLSLEDESISEEDILNEIANLPDTPEGHLAKQILTSLRQLLIREFTKVTQRLVEEVRNENKSLKQRLDISEAKCAILSKRLDDQHELIIQSQAEN